MQLQLYQTNMEVKENFGKALASGKHFEEPSGGPVPLKPSTYETTRVRLGCSDILEDSVKKQHSRFFVLFLTLWLGPMCSAQVIRIRVINSNNGQPLPKQSVSVNLLYDKGEKPPAKYEANLLLETDADGKAQFRLPEPVPAHLGVQVRLTSEHWHCGCMALATTQDVIQKGMSDSESTTSIKNARAEPGIILFLARPFTLLERLLYPLMKG